MSKSSLSILAKAIASKRGLTQAEAERFITKMFEVANAGLEEDKQLKMRWLGSFKVTAVKDRESVDVNTGERIVIEGRDKITFTPDNILKEIINKPFAQFETVVVNDGVDFSDIDEKFARMEMEEEENLAERPIPHGEESQELPQEELTHENPEQETAKLTNSEQNAAEQVVPKQVAEGQGTSEQESSDQPQLNPIGEAEETTAPVILSNEASNEAGQTAKGTVSTPMPNRVSSVVQGLSEQVADLNLGEKVPTSTTGLGEQQEKESAGSINSESSAVRSSDVTTIEKAATSVQVPVSDVSSTSSEKATVSGETQSGEEDLDDDEVSVSKHHFVIPRYVVAIIVVFVLCLMGGMCWFAFNYGKMEAQRDHLAVQLDGMKAKAPKKIAAKPKPAVAQPEDSATLALKEKARQDSIRMAASANAVKMAENSEQKQKEDMVEQVKNQNGMNAKNGHLSTDAQSTKNAPMAKVGQSSNNSNKGQASKIDQKSKLASSKQDAMSSSQFDKDPRVRTGAYRIVGVAKTVTATSGQSLESISKMYLGPGMECYLQALNGKEIKAGQKVRIPKLELKKRK